MDQVAICSVIGDWYDYRRNYSPHWLNRDYDIYRILDVIYGIDSLRALILQNQIPLPEYYVGQTILEVK